MKELFDRLIAETLRLGADRAAVIDAAQIETDRVFRELCLANACGMVGKCWMCPPDVGEIEELMAEVRRYDHALVYQRIGQLEDSFDVEGMADNADGETAGQDAPGEGSSQAAAGQD